MTMTNATTNATTSPTAAGTTAGTTAAHWTGVDPAGHWLQVASSLVPPLAARCAEHDRLGDFVDDGIALARDHGLVSMLVPSEVGGGGASHAEACAVLDVLAHGCPSTALSLSMHSHLVAAQVWRHQRGLPAPVLAKVADAKVLLISTGASDWLQSNGSARRVDDGFVVSAVKQPASGAPAGGVLVTSVRWNDAPDGPKVIHAAVPFTADGVRVEPTWDAMGMRATGSHTVVLDEVFVPDAAVSLVRPAGEWHPVWGTVLGAALPLIMSCYVGVAETAAERAIALAGGRAERPDVASTVGRMLTHLTIARDAVRAMIDASEGLRFDNTLEHAATVLTRKAIAADAVLAVARLAMEVGGGAAYAVSAGIERLVRDLHGSLYHPLPAAQQERFTGRLALGLDPLG